MTSSQRMFRVGLVGVSLWLGLVLGEKLSHRPPPGMALRGRRLEARYLALSGLALGRDRLRRILGRALIDPRTGRPDPEKLNLLDIERAKTWSRVWEVERSGTRSLVIQAELTEVRPHPFRATIPRSVPVPAGLEPYRASRRDDEGSTIAHLGGWSGRIRFQSRARVRGVGVVLEEARRVVVADLSGPAPRYTLFIGSKDHERLGRGRFVLSNLDPGPSLLPLMGDLIQTVAVQARIPTHDLAFPLEVYDRVSDRLNHRHWTEDSLAVWREVSTYSHLVHDREMRVAVDDTILQMDPRGWGRVRTNGVLDVELPIFLPDDVVRYVADHGHHRSRVTEVGFPGRDNRLNDPYFAAYTRFEGRFRKALRRLNHLALEAGPSERRVTWYTPSTLRTYPEDHPAELEPVQLDRFVSHAEEVVTRRLPSGSRWVGTREDPILLDGLWIAQGPIALGGWYRGRGAIVARERIELVRDLRRVDAGGSLVTLVCLDGPVTLVPRTGTRIEASLHAHGGLRGSEGSGINLRGQLTVHHLDRPSMPGSVRIRYDAGIRNRRDETIVGSLVRVRIPRTD